jgi:predicted O-methyltransferase YrrM
MKHIYDTIPGWFSFPNLYKKMVNDLPNGSLLVEVGCYKGCSLSYLIVEMVNAKKSFDIVAVDACPWPDIEPDFYKHMKPLEGYYRTLFGGDSFDRAKDFKDESIDFVFIDANHTYEYVKRDIEAYLPKMKKGSIMAGHDYNMSHPGVIQAVNEAFIEEVNRDFYTPEQKLQKKKPGNGVQYVKEEDTWIVQL